MNKITDEQIYELTQIEFETKAHALSKERILGTIAFGKCNYGYAETKNDIQLLTIYIPSIKDLCSLSVRAEMIDRNKLLDIRLLLTLLKSNSEKGTVIDAIFSKYFCINPAYYNYFQKYFLNIKSFETSQLNINDKIISLNGKFIYLDELEKGIEEIIKLSFKLDNLDTNETKLKLTENETIALEKIIYHELDELGKGYISISKMIDKYGISRPVFTNVLQKLKETKKAKVENKGVKGTYIEIYDLDLLKLKF